MHHWRPCLKLRSAILIVLSTVVAKDANHRFQSKWWKKRDRIGGNREAFSSLETLGCVQRSFGCSHGDVSTEFGDGENLLFSFGSERGPFPKDGPGHLGCRPFLSPAWRISPGCPWIDNFRGFGIRFDNTFLLLLHGLFVSFAFCFRVHVSISTSTVFSADLQEQPVLCMHKRN